MSRKENVEDNHDRFEGLFWAILVLNILASIIGAIVCFCFGIWWAGIACLVDTVLGSLMFAFIKRAWEFLCSCILLKGTKEDPTVIKEEKEETKSKPKSLNEII